MYRIGQLGQLARYTNGNYIVSIYRDGTKIRECHEDQFRPAFPENIDIKISDRCDVQCEFCHEDSKPNGKVAHFNHEFLWSLRPGTELAIGGGNIFANDNLGDFLRFCKHRGVIANITVNQEHFVEKEYCRYNTVRRLLDKGLVHGVGVSINGDPTEIHGYFDKPHPFSFDPDRRHQKNNIVLHAINGVHSFEQIMAFAGKGYKLLILGYKDIRRGKEYYDDNFGLVVNNWIQLHKNIHQVLAGFRIVSFDNLAIEQLHVRNLLTTEQWEEFYMGDDGKFTMYIDLVKGEFASSSTSTKRYSLLSTVDEMFAVVRGLS